MSAGESTLYSFAFYCSGHGFGVSVLSLTGPCTLRRPATARDEGPPTLTRLQCYITARHAGFCSLVVASGSRSQRRHRHQRADDSLQRRPAAVVSAISRSRRAKSCSGGGGGGGGDIAKIRDVQEEEC